MVDDHRKDLIAPDQAPIDPVAMARRDLKKQLPKRFWSDVTVASRDGLFGVDLDGRPVRTPGKALLLVPSRNLAERVAGEWQAQTEWVEPDSMPLTRLVNTAIDAVSQAMDATIAETAKFAETDLVCYRAGDPQSLVHAQADAWDPILGFARDTLGARFVCAEGVMYVEQPQAARNAVREALTELAGGRDGALRLSAISLMTNLTGSVLIALAVAHARIDTATAWTSAHVDEDYQMRMWGADAEATARRDLRWRDMRAAAEVLLSL